MVRAPEQTLLTDMGKNMQVSKFSVRRALSPVLAGMMAFAAVGCASQQAVVAKQGADVKVQSLQRCQADLDAAKSAYDSLLKADPSNALGFLGAYNQMLVHIDGAAAISSLFANVHPDEAVRKAAEKCEQDTSAFVTKLGLDRALYDVFAKVSPEGLDADARRVLEKAMRDFTRSGVDKDEATRARIATLKAEILQAGQNFGRNIREDVRSVSLKPEQLDGMPADYIAAHKAGEDGMVTVTTDYPDYIPFMKSATDAAARAALAKEFRNRGYPKNIAVLNGLLAKRHELATLLGFKNWAAFITADKMIKSDTAVAEFVEKVSAIAGPRAKAEYAELLEALRKDQPDATAVSEADKSFYEQKVKAEKYAFDALSVRPYFQYNKVRDGLLALTGTLFGISYKPVTDAEKWHADVDVYDVFAGDVYKGRIYLDMHPRAGKYKHAAMFTVKSGVKGVQAPEGALICNFPHPGDGKGLMDHSQVVTYFHEFGHLLHHVLGGHQKWVPHSGVATEWDFVEAPSQFFEDWAWEPSVLQRFATHVDTGEPIPAELVQKMKAANDYGRGMHVRQQMFYAALALALYAGDPTGLDTTAKVQELQAKYSVYPYMEDTHFQVSFGHLYGYSAMYYTYMWSLVIARDLKSGFAQNGLMDTAAAQKYRDTVLAPGGSKDAADLVEDFLGRPYSFDAYKAWLTEGQPK